MRAILRTAAGSAILLAALVSTIPTAANALTHGHPHRDCSPSGAPLAALTELYRAAGDDRLLAKAPQLADASTTSTSLNDNGILHDPGEKPGGGGADGPSFKGIYARDLAVLDSAITTHPYAGYLNRQADSAYANDRNAAGQYGLMWAGPFDKSDAARQQSALDLMNATY